MRKGFLFLVFLMVSVPLVAELPAWTFCYRKTFDKNSLIDGERAFERVDVAPFSHLIFSFNALQPLPKGAYYRFSVCVRGAKSKNWLSWHRMFEWGNGVQRSFADKIRPDGYSHVRLDMHGGTQADGFRIRVEGINGALLAGIKLLSASVAQLTDFKAESSLERYADSMSVYVSGVPCWSQMTVEHPRASVICSPTSLCMVTSYILNEKLDVGKFADGVYDKKLDIFGNWTLNTAYAFTMCPRCHFYVQRLHSFFALYQILRKGIPVVVSVRGKLRGAPKAYPSGHLLAVVGFDAEKGTVVCHDPAAPAMSEVEREYELTDFLQAWERSYRLAYVLSVDVA
jgi:hypothetical protein